MFPIKDYVQYRRAVDTPGLVLSVAHFSEFRFDRHYHLDYHLGLVSDGVQRQHFGGSTVLLGAGCISVMPPDEIHDGVSVNAGAYTLRTFRMAPALLHSLAAEISSTPGEPKFGGTMIEDPCLATRLLALHRMAQREDHPA